MNKFQKKILEQAELELDDAFDYYEYQLPGLGKRFLEEFSKCVKRILSHPFSLSSNAVCFLY